MNKTKKKGIVGFISENDGRRFTFDEYIMEVRLGREPGALPIPILEGIKAMILDHEDVGNSIRVTSMLGCSRNLYFEQEVGVEYIKPSQFYPMFRGIMSHKVMEANKPLYKTVDEQRFRKSWNGMEITGKPDRIIPGEKTIIDYKTTAKVPDFGIVYTSHTEQLNLYRWLVSDSYNINRLQVLYMDMATAKLNDVRIWSEQELKGFLDKKVKEISEALKGNIPKYEKIWLCDFCPFTSICKKTAVEEFKQELLQRKKSKPLSVAEIMKEITKFETT